MPCTQDCSIHVLLPTIASVNVAPRKSQNQSQKHVITLSTTDLETLQHLASHIHVCSDAENNADAFCEQVASLSQRLPSELHKSLAAFAAHGSMTGFLLIRGVHVDSVDMLPHTPPTNTFHVGMKTTLAKVQAILASALGTMIAYEAEGHGKLFQDIVPAESMNHLQTSLSSVELEIHTEQCFSKWRPDVLSLACIRGDQCAYTYVLPVGTIIEHMTSEELARLRQPLWKTRVDLSFKLNGEDFLEGDVRGPFPILSGPTSDPQLLFDQDLMFGTTEEATCLIRKIVNIYYVYREMHRLEPGDVLFIDNTRAVHGRSSFRPKYDGYDRFLIRCFVVFDYEKSRSVRPDGHRAVAAKYS